MQSESPERKTQIYQAISKNSRQKKVQKLQEN